MIKPTNIDIASLQTNNIDHLKNVNAKNSNNDELMKAAQDFEAVFITKLFQVMDSTVQKSGLMGNGKNENMFKSLMHQDIAKNIASNPHTSFGLAKQIYEQMKDMG